MSTNKPTNSQNETSGGHMTEAGYLDDHYEALKPEYEQMAHMAGIQPGWKILDAGCGGGSYLQLLAELVGESGHITATDLADENIDRVLNRIEQGEFNCEIEARTANVIDLPFADNSFDAIWCAAVTQYLSDDEVLLAFNEFKRVVKPGGLIAIKEADFTAIQFGPFPFDAIWRAFIADMYGLTHNVLRSPTFAKMFRDLGLADVRSQTVLMERFQPLRAVEKRWLSEMFKFMSSIHLKLDLSDKDKVLWHALHDIDTPQHILNNEDFFYRGSHNLTVGRVPTR